MNIKTKIDLNIWAYIDDNFFTSELDKINFYREIESLHKLEELKILIKDFKEINKNIPKETQNFFDLLKLKIYAYNYNISHIKKVGINYQIEFNSLSKSSHQKEKDTKQLDILKNFLKLDKEIKFNVVNLTKIRSQNKNFENEEKFVEYLLLIFEKKIKKVKIKLKR